MEKIGYVYKKDGKYKIYNHKKALIKHDSLIKKGWIHDATIDVFIWIEYQLNYKTYEKSN